MPKAAVLGAAAVAPAALCVAAPKTRSRDVVVVVLQMWAYLAAYELPNDDPAALAARVHTRYPVEVDKLIGFGKIPSQRLQEVFSRPGQINSVEKALVWCHWLWFFVPHSAIGYVAIRQPGRLTSAATRMYAVYDLGAAVYWTLPTAPPWWAARQGLIKATDGPAFGQSRGGQVGAADGDLSWSQANGGEPAAEAVDDQAVLPVRRMMLEYGEQFWGPRWKDLVNLLGGNPLAAMPSLHFATSLMAARVLSEVGPVAGAIGWTYAAGLGFALVYLGEHYAIDLIAGAALAGTVQAASRPAGPVLRVVPRGLDALRALGAE